MPTTCNGGPQRTLFNLTHFMALGTYVYGLFDPRDNCMIYVGKGNENRVFDHFFEADRTWDMVAQAPRSDATQLSAKVCAIHRIWQAGLDVVWKILAYDISTTVKGIAPTPDTIAHEIEASLMDAISMSRNGATTNAVSGIRMLSKGPLDESQVWPLGWPPVNPVWAYPTVFGFQIHKARTEGRDVYEATRRAWTVNSDNVAVLPAVAVGIESGFSVGAFEIRQWDQLPGGKWQFTGDTLRGHELDQKDWRNAIKPVLGYLQRGGGYFIASLDGKGNICYRRGIENPIKGKTFPL